MLLISDLTVCSTWEGGGRGEFWSGYQAEIPKKPLGFLSILNLTINF